MSRMSLFLRLSPQIVFVLSLLLAGGCLGGSKKARRYKKAQVQKRLKEFETPGLLIGEFPLARNAIVDGDTVKVSGLDTSLRLSSIDTEETFKSDADRRLYEAGFQEYLKAKRGKSLKPVKCATPLGEEAKDYAKKFFADAEVVRLERDHPKELRGRYGRYLAYVFARKKGKWINYNVECVRAGMSPYFTKYAYSRRFHDEFVQAQKEAQQKRIGIWDPSKEHYPDYAERLDWWNARADFIKAFEQEAEGKDNYIVLTHWDSLRQLEQNVGKQVVLLGLVGDIKLGDRGPTKVMLGRRLLSDFPLVFFDKDVFGSSGVARHTGEFVRVEGVVQKWHNKHTKRDELQIMINLPGQIKGSDRLPDYSGWDTEGPDPETEAEGLEMDHRDPGQEEEEVRHAP
ncbi:MAG: thermonuclease family protein [Deltaproteobacteria bacterium]|nr:thermonuclease family protein [Deltaproteobacteria bacterium]